MALVSGGNRGAAAASVSRGGNSIEVNEALLTPDAFSEEEAPRQNLGTDEGGSASCRSSAATCVYTQRSASDGSGV